MMMNPKVIGISQNLPVLQLQLKKRCSKLNLVFFPMKQNDGLKYDTYMVQVNQQFSTDTS